MNLLGNLIETLTTERVVILSVFDFSGGLGCVEGSSPPVPEKQKFITMFQLDC